MYVSVTGLRTKGFIAWLRFWRIAIPTFMVARKSKGILFCETDTIDGVHYTLTVWQTRHDMLMFRNQPWHMKAINVFPDIANGKIYGYEADAIPSWPEAIEQLEAHGLEA